MPNPPIRRALISVSDKTGLSEFAQALVASGVEIFSTGGTRAFLEKNGIAAQDIAAYTGFPEMLEGRLKTLHPKVFGGILCRHDQAEDMQSIAAHGIATFELVVVNLYPFAATIAKPNVAWEEAVEQIDIGGPSLVRAASKNHAFVTVATQPKQYAEILSAIQSSKSTSLELRKRLAAEAFAHTAEYDQTIAGYFAQELARDGGGTVGSHAGHDGERFPDTISLELQRQQVLRHGENPHQQGAVYRLAGESGPSLVAAKQLNGKELSYNNLLDLDSALTIVRSFDQPAATVIKHNNPCGAAVGDSLAVAAKRALDGDPQSAFGGIVGFNRAVDAATAELLATPGLFLEAIVAPSFDAAALDILKTKPKWRQNVRLMEVGSLSAPPACQTYRHIEGGMLVQDADAFADPEADWKCVTEAQVNEALLAELRFAWLMVRHVKSNAIVLCQNTSLVGAGAGQMSRVDSVDISIQKAGPRAKGSVLGSDAFFPFPDSIHKAADAGIAAIIQPGGSVKDAEVIAACNQHRLPMIFTGRRHFKH
jgi:phosphoribosylaminoimidazolecarboxamide formyltransferase/IMP cyclohydrolase